MPLTTIPQKTEDSLGIVKQDSLPYTNPNTQVPAAQYERLKDAVIANALAIGLGNGSTPGSLVTRVNALETTGASAAIATRVTGVDDFTENPQVAWMADVNAPASLQHHANVAPGGFPGAGVLMLGASPPGPNQGEGEVHVRLVRAATGLAFGDGEPIVLEYRFAPAQFVDATPGTPGPVSQLQAPTAAGSDRVNGVPALQGEGPAPFFVRLDNGTDQEIVRVNRRSDTELQLDGTTDHAYSAGDTAAYAGPALGSIAFANDRFTWLLGATAGDLDAGEPAVVFGGMWDRDTDTQTTALIVVDPIGGISGVPFSLPNLGSAAAYRARLTIAAGGASLEIAVEAGPYTTVATYGQPIANRIYGPLLQAGGADDVDRALLVDYVTWAAHRQASNAIGGVESLPLGTAGGDTSPNTLAIDVRGESFSLENAVSFYTVEAFTSDVFVSFPGGVGDARWWFVRVRYGGGAKILVPYDSGQTLNGFEGPGTFEIRSDPSASDSTFIFVRTHADGFFVIPLADVAAHGVRYAPGNVAHWNAAPDSTATALDQLAARVRALENA